MDRAFSLIVLIPAMIAVTPATAQAVGTTEPAVTTTASPAAIATIAAAEAPKPRTVRIAGRTVAVDSLPPSEDATPAPKVEPRTRARR